MGGGKGRRKRKERKVAVLKGCEAVEIGAGGGGLRDQTSIFRNRQKGYIEEAKKNRGGSRKCKVREARGLDPHDPPPPNLPQR